MPKGTKRTTKVERTGPQTTPPRVVTETMTASTRTLLTMLRSKVVVNSKDGSIKLKSQARLVEALSILGGADWAAEVVEQAREVVRDHNQFNSQERVTFIVP